MRTISCFMLSLVLLCWGIIGISAAADGVQDNQGAKAAASSGFSVWNWFGGWFGAGKKADEKKPAAGRDKGAADPVPVPFSAVPTAQKMAEKRTQAEADLLRRLAVCNRLLQIASETNDEQLRQQVEQLDRRASAIYARSTAGTSSASLAKGDEQILDRRLQAKTPPRPLFSSPVHDVPGQDVHGRAGPGGMTMKKLYCFLILAGMPLGCWPQWRVSLHAIQCRRNQGAICSCRSEASCATRHGRGDRPD